MPPDSPKYPARASDALTEPPAVDGVTTKYSTAAWLTLSMVKAVSSAAHSLPLAKVVCSMRESLLSRLYSGSGANGSVAPRRKVAHPLSLMQSRSGVLPVFCTDLGGSA